MITSPEWSGSETGGRRYAPFTINIENLKPFHTLTGRMHFYLAHDWVEELGEHLPVYRPPLDMARLFNTPELGAAGDDGIGLTVRYLTPHSKWSFHSTYQDNLYMLSLSRGGPTMWMSPGDAEKIGARDNDWVEAVNVNGVFVCRAIVSQRMPEGGLRLPRAGAHRGHPAYRDHRQARRQPQLADPGPGQTQPPRRRVRPALLRLQLHGAHRKPARRGDGRASPQPGGALLMRKLDTLSEVRR
ncbi:hypothetical protein MKOR_41020 [Mycolicibacillus koreensis]|nr:hypothetical protein MKOR_41020 [Mycolicibacillus koreensis]